MRTCACGCGSPIRWPARKWARGHRAGDPGPVLLPVEAVDATLDPHAEITLGGERLIALWRAGSHELHANEIWLAEHPTDEAARAGTTALAAACRHALRRIRLPGARVRLDHLLALVLAATCEVATSIDEPLLAPGAEMVRLEETQQAIVVALRLMGLLSG